MGDVIYGWPLFNIFTDTRSRSLLGNITTGSREDFCVSRASVSSVDFLEFCPLILTGMIAARSLDDRHTGHGASAALYTLI